MAHKCQEIKDKISPKIWNNYLKIASIRCPYDIAVSAYYYRKHFRFRFPEHINSFEQFILYHKEAPAKAFSGPYCALMHCNGKIAADFLCRYEYLDEDIKKLEDKINCPGLLNTFKSKRAYTRIRPKKETEPYIMYSKYPKAKLALDEMLYKQQDNYEFVRKYWPMYKTTLEKNIAQYERGDMNTKV